MMKVKTKLSEIIQNAVNDGSQEISVKGKTMAVIISINQYVDLISPKSSFVQFLQNSLLRGLKIDLERDKSSCREIEL
ncbi:type II toxin-antitoxin system prevent-host-death family antitoxin [Candidatus Tisiphia endosymbiont of Micropterix aruncella]|uniref:type II toxin-antitoxin system prevent-host-death family antitoxin n=1 Tax=Candidatus Tisiphia endosymbiont of Micropterix aruncella TaxID=3066271 RepID=UPI003AA80323